MACCFECGEFLVAKNSCWDWEVMCLSTKPVIPGFTKSNLQSGMRQIRHEKKACTVTSKQTFPFPQGRLFWNQRRQRTTFALFSFSPDAKVCTKRTDALFTVDCPQWPTWESTGRWFAWNCNFPRQQLADLCEVLLFFLKSYGRVRKYPTKHKYKNLIAKFTW